MKRKSSSLSFVSKPLRFLLALLIVLILALITLRDRPSPVTVGLPGVRVTVGGSTEPTAAAVLPNDRLLGGLLSPDFDEQSCLSRYQTMLYRKASSHILSSYLLSKLRKYEVLHKKCAPNTPLYQKSVEQIKLNHSTELECNYVIWSPYDGIGNRMLSLTATFLYALLTNRVMLVHQTEDMVDLLCEPFPGTTWYLPSNFPIHGLDEHNKHSNNSYGYLVEKNMINTDPKAPPYSLPSSIYVHLLHDMREDHLHVRFYCDDDQEVISKINWVMLKTNQYIIPGFFIIPKYAEELARMFPSKETVFHHLGRYLLHPSNTVWGMIMRYHNSYLAKSEEKIGIQVRIFYYWAPISPEKSYEQVVRCTQQELILPGVNVNQSQISPSTSTEARTVLLVSLYGEIYERLHSLYFEHPTTTGEMISVYQPSHEEKQQTEKKFHNYKALAEIWLLSFSDVLVTSAGSTFGYVSYGLAGIKPWYLQSSLKGRNIQNPSCYRAASIDACYHTPPHFNCKTGGNADPRNIVRHVRQCDDYTHSPTVKLFD